MLVSALSLCLLGNVYAESRESIEQIIKAYSLRESAISLKDTEYWVKPKTILVRANKERLQWLQETVPDVELIAVNNEDEVLSNLSQAQALMGYCSDNIFKHGQHLNWIQVYSAGVDHCFKPTTKIPKGLNFSNAQRLSGPQIAEHAIALMFTLVRGIDQYHLAQQKSNWDDSILPGNRAVWELSGRTMLVVGLGGIGSEVAKRAHALGMNVIATRNSSRKGPKFVSYVGLADELLNLAAKADVVVNATPLTASTTGLFDKHFFKAMKSNAYFISIGRGKSTVTEDLLESLKNAELAGAGLDVTDPEPLPKSHPLWTHPRVIITPHISYRSDTYGERRWMVMRENLRRYVHGEKLLSTVNLRRKY